MSTEQQQAPTFNPEMPISEQAHIVELPREFYIIESERNPETGSFDEMRIWVSIPTLNECAISEFVHKKPAVIQYTDNTYLYISKIEGGSCSALVIHDLYSKNDEKPR